MKFDIIAILGRIFKRRPKPYRVGYVHDPPAKAKKDTVYLHMHLGQPWQATFECPCGCSETIALNLTRHYRPSWRYHLDGRKITFSPSIRRIEGCKSHFFLRNGMVEWCEDCQIRKGK